MHIVSLCTSPCVAVVLPELFSAPNSTLKRVWHMQMPSKCCRPSKRPQIRLQIPPNNHYAHTAVEAFKNSFHMRGLLTPKFAVHKFSLKTNSHKFPRESCVKTRRGTSKMPSTAMLYSRHSLLSINGVDQTCGCAMNEWGQVLAQSQWKEIHRPNNTQQTITLSAGGHEKQQSNMAHLQTLHCEFSDEQ